MSGRRATSPVEPYSPNRRTALLLTGTGTAGAYHAGVLRALHEAGVKLDVAAGRGIGAIGALFAAVDGAPSLWSDTGFWRSPIVQRLYGWRTALRVLAWSVAAAAVVVSVPVAAVALGLVVYPIDFILKMVGLSGSGLVGWYLEVAQAAFAPTGLPTWLPRIALLILGGATATAAVIAAQRPRPRQTRGQWWWHLADAPLTADLAVAHAWGAVWDLVRGAAQPRLPSRVDLARRYTELLADNIGQPGFRELVLVVHDVDAGRDLVFALVSEARRRDLVRRPLMQDVEARRAEVFDLAGADRDHLTDALAAAMTIPLATGLHNVTFAPDSYWRGETHRLSDRAGSLERLLQELAALNVEQIILVSAAPDATGPHALASARLDARDRLGEYLRSSEAATVRDALERRRVDEPRVFLIRPAHNPVGPLDFSGGFDDRSDRAQGLAELMSRGYEDAYHQFIEPIVGASGDRVGRV
ncbi:MAG: hypothetical protein U0Q11_27690 [Vicinamibacterales bacterium]